MMGMKSILKRTARVLSYCNDVKKVLIINTGTKDPNFTYLTGFRSGLFEGNILIVEKNRIQLLTNPLEYSAAKNQQFNELKIMNVTRDGQLKKVLSKELSRSKIGIDESFIPYSTYKRIKKYKPKKIIDVSEAFSKARMIKDKDEVSAIREANKITKRAMGKIQNKFKTGITEKELAREFNYLSAGFGSDGPSFDTIVCFGRNAAIPHHSPGNTKLKRGDFVLVDAGSKIRNYCSDVTRTFIFGRGKGYAKKMEIYRIVKEAQKLAIKSIKEGVKAKKVHLIAQNYIDRAAKGRYKGRFIHSLGHSIGLEVHDGEGRMLSPNSNLVLKEGMVTSVEPGIYLPGFGGVRIEDDVLVTKKGAAVL